jgi:hypothetical protein
MNPFTDATRARRYLLGDLDEEARAAIEEEYFADENAVDAIAAAEDDLIEDYLSNRLVGGDRERFERHYLASPRHRIRVETVRRLIAAAGDQSQNSSGSSGGFSSYGPWLALAASLIIIVSVGLWLYAPGDNPSATIIGVANPKPPPASPSPRGENPPRPAPRLFALSLSPAGVRTASDTPAATIPAGTDIVAIRLERDAENRNLTPRRAIIRTIGGRQAWQGPVATDGNPPGVAARAEVPAAAIPVDDYLLTLYGADQKGVEVEWAQYFLRVRNR